MLLAYFIDDRVFIGITWIMNISLEFYSNTMQRFSHTAIAMHLVQTEKNPLPVLCGHEQKPCWMQIRSVYAGKMKEQYASMLLHGVSIKISADTLTAKTS